ncbi:hypothetical protein TWF106_000621 [Orbilia oligospora]|uniref:Uncharacterized protein n=1 Tax=Orbilia oligospora TaxID=2813651 RepID=A0A6G1M313_ORBOL|nr:hypothetical protein TWF788_000795 [Orbilia oligospora]KAF3200842.1 hypothetical protein TWF679_000596 [Orbilia oligospora]KAF3206745.1 hypothetical protein TWF106_000621 [Orbilia oligospora]KAF3220187.1 hypothetical protein TWF191_007503 [Orbilia oligospora]KAF3243397.1 hypothetical protein TWF192_008304 [Orbilia oligospora]
MGSIADQIPITDINPLKKLRDAIDNKLRDIVSQTDENSIDWKAKLKELLDEIYKLCCENWNLLKFILFTAGAALSIPILLQIAGFSLLGPVAGSFAAAWQASIGNVAAGSFFAFLQSISMAPATAMITGALIGFGAFVWVELKREPDAPAKPVPDHGDDDDAPGDGTPPGNAQKSGAGRRLLNPLRSLYDGYRVARYGFSGKTRFRG